jgi:hypothetical protein
MIRSWLVLLLLLFVESRALFGASDNPKLFPITEYGPNFPQPGSVKSGFIDETGKVVIPLSADYLVMMPSRAPLRCFVEGLQPVTVGLKTKWRPNSWGYLDTKGNFAIEPQFGPADAFSEGLAAAFGDGGWGYIDHTGKFVVAPQFESASSFSEGAAMVETHDHLFGYIDPEGKWLVPAQYSAAAGDGGFHEGLACVGKKAPADPANPASPGFDYLWGYIDKTGAQVLNFKFKQPSPFSEGLAAINENGTCGYIDKTGAFVIPPKFSSGGEFSEGLARVFTKEGKMAYINHQGDVDFSIDHPPGCEPFSEGLAEAEIPDPSHQSPNGALHGFIDRTGKFVIAPKYFGASSFYNGLARVVSKTESGYIDKTGNFVWKTKAPDLRKMMGD